MRRVVFTMGKAAVVMAFNRWREAVAEARTKTRQLLARLGGNRLLDCFLTWRRNVRGLVEMHRCVCSLRCCVAGRGWGVGRGAWAHVLLGHFCDGVDLSESTHVVAEMLSPAGTQAVSAGAHHVL